MQKINYVFDCDGVLVDSEPDFINFLEKKVNKKYPKNKSYALASKIFGIEIEKLYEYFDEYNLQGNAEKLSPIGNSQEVINFLKNEHNSTFHIVTARNKKICQEQTEVWAKKHFNFLECNIHCTEYVDFKPLEDKVEIFEKIQGHIFVEDSWSNAFAVAQACSDSLVLLYTQPQNSEISLLDFLPNMRRVYNWNDVKNESLLYEYLTMQ